MRSIKIIVIILFPAILLCCKQDVPVPEKKEAILRYTGPYEVDGCGFFLIADGTEYKPVNENEIDDSFKTEYETEVVAEYTVTAEPVKNVCFAPQPHSYPGIKIFSLQKK